MQFNPRDLLAESGYKNNELKRLDSVADYNRSYMSEALDFVSECNSIMDTATKAFYKALLEADTNDMVAITESFADFKDSVANIITKFLKFIKSLFDRFITMLTGLVKAEGHLKKNKALLSKFSSEHEFKVNGYTYTFRPGIPSLTPVDELAGVVGTLFTLNHKVEDISREYQLQTDNLETYYDKKRAAIVGKGTDAVVYESDFSDELFRTFRDGDNGRSEIIITKAKVDESYIRFDNYETTRKQVVKDKQAIENRYKELKQQIEKLGTRGTSGNDVTLTYTDPTTAGATQTVLTGKDTVVAMELLFKLHADKVQKLSDMHALAFAAKLDALKECFIHDKAILYKALSRVQKTAYKEAVVQEFLLNKNSKTNTSHSSKTITYDEYCAVYAPKIKKLSNLVKSELPKVLNKDYGKYSNQLKKCYSYDGTKNNDNKMMAHTWFPDVRLVWYEYYKAFPGKNLREIMDDVDFTKGITKIDNEINSMIKECAEKVGLDGHCENYGDWDTGSLGFTIKASAVDKTTIHEGNVILAKNVFVLQAPNRDCDELFADTMYKDEFNDPDMDEDIDIDSDDELELPMGDEEVSDDFEFDVPGEDPDEDDEVIHDDDDMDDNDDDIDDFDDDDDISDIDDEDIEDIEESLFFAHALDKLVQESIDMIGGRL